MENESLSPTLSRATVAAQFFNKLHRAFETLLHFWWVLVLGAACGFGVELYLLRHAPPSYASTGRMIVASKMNLPNASAYSEELLNFLGTQMGLMESDVVSNRAVMRLRSEKPLLAFSPTHIEVSISPKTSIFNLRATSRDGDYAQAFLQMDMEEYVALKKEMLRDASDSTKVGVQQEIAAVGAELQAAKQELIAYGASNNEVYLQNQGNSAGEYLAGLTKELADRQSELELLKTLTLDENAERLVGMQQGVVQNPTQGTGGASAQPAPTIPSPSDSNAQEGGNSGDSPAHGTTTQAPAHSPSAVADNQGSDSASSFVGSEQDYLKAKQTILLMKAHRDELSKYLRPQHPKIIALNEQIDRQEKLLEIFRGQTKEQLQARQHTLEVEIANLQQDINVWKAKAVQLSKKMADFQAIKDKIQRLQNISDSMFATESTVDLTKDASPESVSILEDATPAVLAKIPIVQRASITAAAGFVAAMLLLILFNRLDDRPHSYADLQELCDETILGQVPSIRPKDKTDPQALILNEEDDRHAFVEAYRNLRSSIVFHSLPNKPDSHPRIILLTSAIPGDGKSVTTANLAITLARSGSRVLIVDADLRRGVMHKLFGIDNKNGLSEVLDNKIPWSKAVTQNSVPNLFLLPRGSVPRHPAELFMKSIRQQFLAEAGGQYDYVLVDTPPIMAADDVSNLAPYVDGILMVIRAHHTSGRIARAALDLLYLRKVNLLGIVFNGVKTTGGDYYYYKYKEYYRKHAA